VNATRAVASSARRLARRLRRSTIDDLRSPRRTVNAPVFARPAPRPSSFRSFGEGSWIVPPCRVDGPGRIDVGEGVVLLEHAEITVAPGASLRLGHRVRLGRFAVLDCRTSIELGDDVAGSDGVGIGDGVVVEAGAYLGANSVLHPGVRVGRGAYVGEGAAVVEDVPARAVVFGNPAQVVRVT
jgi:acetyltransferase-like isoleucine patch superfamily enzyme